MYYNTTTEKKYNAFKKGQIKQLLCDIIIYEVCKYEFKMEFNELIFRQ